MAELATRPPFYHSDSDDSTSKSQWQTERRLVEYSSSSTVRVKKKAVRASLVCLSAHVRPSSIEQQPRHHCVISCYRKRNPLLPSPMKKIIVVVLVVARSRLRNRVTLRRTLCNEKMQRSTESRRYIAYNIFYAFNLCLFLFFSPSIPRFRANRSLSVRASKSLVASHSAATTRGNERTSESASISLRFRSTLTACFYF